MESTLAYSSKESTEYGAFTPGLFPRSKKKSGEKFLESRNQAALLVDVNFPLDNDRDISAVFEELHNLFAFSR